MSRRGAVIGTSIALAGFSGLGIAAIGAADNTTPLRPAADTVETETVTQTQTATVEDRTATVEDRATRGTRHRHRQRNRGRGSAHAAQNTGPAIAPSLTQKQTTTTQSDDGPNHDLGDDHGGRGEVEAGDDHGGRGENEAGDDHGGDDHHSGPGRGGRDD
jgi:hypothetical protein